MKIRLSPSSMELYLTCPRKFYYSKILGKSLKNSQEFETPNIQFGGMIARARELMGKGANNADEVLEVLEPEFHTKSQLVDLDLDKRFSWGHYTEMVSAIFDTLNFSNFKTISSEREFHHDLTNWFSIMCISDSIVEEKSTGDLYVMEDKTIGGPYVKQFYVNQSTQTDMNLLLAQIEGLPVKGIIYNFYDTSGWSSRTKKLLTEPWEMVTRHPIITRTDSELQEFEIEIVKCGQRIKTDLESGMWQKHKKSCFVYNKSCPFLQVCNQSPEFRDSILEQQYETIEWEGYEK